jgi:chromosome segregation ATPase
MEAPSDDQLAESFGVSVNLDLKELTQQAESLGPGVASTRSSKSKQGKREAAGKEKGGTDRATLLSKEMESPSPGEGSKSGGGKKRNKYKAILPKHGGVQKQLDAITSSISGAVLPNAPPEDVATVQELEDMSVRSSRIEEELGDLATQLTVAQARIESLELEQSSLVSKYTETMKELTTIKEMVKRLGVARSEDLKGKSSKIDDITRAPPALIIGATDESPRAGGKGQGLDQANRARETVDSRSRIKKKKII